MGYENAPATKMLATDCAICRRPLVDAKSVEIGIGPICRKKYDYDTDDVTEEDRVEANKIIYELALKGHGDAKLVVESCEKLFSLGMVGVTKAVLKKAAAVKITLDEKGRYVVKSDYIPDGMGALFSVPGRWFDWEKKVNVFPARSKVKLWNAIKETYPGCAALGPNGPFVIPHPSPSKEGPDTPAPPKGEIVYNGDLTEEELNAECARNVKKSEEEDLQEVSGPPEGSWAATARLMSDGDDDFDWDSWKDQMKERYA